MKQLFHAFASRAAGSVAKPGGGRSGRVALGLQDCMLAEGVACTSAKEQVREDVDFIINTMFNRDNLPRFESTVGPDDEVWIRAMTKHTISNIDTHSVEISEKDAHQAQHRNCQDGSSRPNEKAHSACPSNSAGRSSADQVGRAVSDFRGSDFKDPAQPGWKHLDLLRGEFVLMRRNHHVNGWSYGAVFHETTERFGSPADSGEPALAFELFVELLVETARRQFADLKDAESAAALFEVHLLPLARRLWQPRYCTV
ncbi:unnamed protein product [Effrenium voratum]|nr:unnamed protein product [Effrenium voratum]